MQRPVLVKKKEKKAASFAWELGLELAPAALHASHKSVDSGAARESGPADEAMLVAIEIEAAATCCWPSSMHSV